MSESSSKYLSRRTMEIVTAILTGFAGGAICYGSVKIGIGWGETGPESGYFPFYVGLLIILGSVVNLVRGLMTGMHRDEVFLDWERARPVLGFFLPLVAFLIVSLFLGLYIGTALYIFGMMIWQGGYRPSVAALSGIAVTIFFYVVFEIGFKVPLLKGPVEGWLGIY